MLRLDSDMTTPSPSPTTVIDKIQEVFPGALESAKLSERVKETLTKHGFQENTTLVATSLCCDEVNRELEGDFTKIYHHNFNMGGLAGFSFSGVTGFGAMASHIPKNGSCLLLYGPHVGVDFEGTVGKVNRRGLDDSGACCGSAAAACAYVKSVHGGGEKHSAYPDSALDAQQFYVGTMLLPQAARIVKAKDENVEVPLALFDVQDEFMRQIVDKGCGKVAGEGMIALLGGIQINTPVGVNEYFLPKVFEIRNNKGDKVVDLLSTL